jgi:3alpha(or 20beta)-hydroxysteroid dehydrogenase
MSERVMTTHPSDIGSYWHDKAVVVTGGARGQGAALVGLLLQAGAEVHVMDSLPGSDPAWLELKQQAQGTAGTLQVLQHDIAETATWEAMTGRLQAGSRVLAGLVNNAGITGPRNTVTRSSLDDWERVMRVNLTAAFLGIRALAPLMSRGASIVNIGSTAGMTGYYSAAYSTSKWALRGLTRSAALELAAQGIRVNCVCPGVVDTEMIRNSPPLVAALQNVIPVRHMAQPQQIAEAVFYLLGPGASYITGTDLAVDGGVTGGGIYGPVGRATGAL